MKIRIIVGFAAGGPNDILARLMGRWLSERAMSRMKSKLSLS
jgi:tripartite-type tricarboxylate transporter receptor subunit TctC